METKPIKARLVPTGSKVVTECSDGSSFFTLGRLDGFYLNSRSEKGGQVLVSMIEPLFPNDDGTYRIATDEEYEAFEKALHKESK